jgi:diphthine-ammonia ligase
MKFVALLSGGKDSVFCIEKCMEYGHELVCVANLYPPVDPDRNGDEINSYMYQSAAFSAIPMQAECLGVPLVRREILGQAHLQTLNYEVTSDDETEDLYELLRDVLVR